MALWGTVAGFAAIAALAACGHAGAQAQDPEPAAIIAALLGAEQRGLAELEGCEPGFPEAPAPTLSADIAAHLAYIGPGGGRVSAECWPPEPGGRICTVGIGREAGEEVWTRYYRFTLTPEGEMAPNGLSCFTVP